MKFFTDIGFSEYYLRNMTDDELADSYNYIRNYSNKGITMTPNIDPVLYARLKAINDKYHIFYKLG